VLEKIDINKSAGGFAMYRLVPRALLKIEAHFHRGAYLFIERGPPRGGFSLSLSLDLGGNSKVERK
jgi:hypothetical protein